MKETHRLKIVYLLAASHSGSTLTGMLLGAHPDVSCVGELKANHLGDTSSYLCSCKKKILECPFWRSISNRMMHFGEKYSIADSGTDIFSDANRFDSIMLKPLVRKRGLECLRDTALLFSANWRHNLPIIQRRNSLLIESILDETNTKMIVDSSKIGIRLKYLLRNPDLEVKVIWLTRDGRGVSLAYLNPNEFADASDEKMRGGGTGLTIESSREISTGAHEWRRCNEEAINILATLQNNQKKKIKYEDLCLSPDSILDDIFQFLEVDRDKKIADFRSINHHVVGNGMRLDSTSEIFLDERWKTELDFKQLRSFDKIAGDLNRYLGYE